MPALAKPGVGWGMGVGGGWGGCKYLPQKLRSLAASTLGTCPAMRLKDLVSPRFAQGHSGDLVTQEIALVLV